MFVLAAASLLGVILATPPVLAGNGTAQPPRRYRATLIPIDRVPVATSVDGIVARYHAPLMTTVRAGEPLLELDANEAGIQSAIAEARLTTARSVVRQAETELAYLKQLLATEGARQLDVDRATSEVDIARGRKDEAEAQVRFARSRLAAHSIRAPRDGVLVARRKLPGQGVRGYETVCELLVTTELLAVVQVPLAELDGLELGTKTQFQSDLGEVECTCHEIGVEVNAGARTVRVMFRLSNPAGELRPGMPGEVVLDGPR